MAASATITPEVTKSATQVEKRDWQLEPRTALVRDLLQRAGQPKLIYAPSLYGKTALARQYVQASAGSVQTAWISANHPTFLHHLYEGTLPAYCHEVCHNLRLVVFDDLPQLGRSLLHAFNEALEALPEKVDVLITSRYNEFAQANPHRVYSVDAGQLLVNIDEMQAYDPARTDAFFSFPAWRKVAGIFYGKPTQRVVFEGKLVAAAQRGEMEPLEALALILGSGMNYELQAYFLEDIDAMVKELANEVPHCGFEVGEPSFSAIALSNRSRVDVLVAIMPALMDCSPFGTKGELMRVLLEHLLRGGQDELAVQCALAVLQPKDCLEFVHEHGEQYLFRGKVQQILALVGTSKKLVFNYPETAFLYAQALMLANRPAEANQCLEVLALSEEPTFEQVYALLLSLYNNPNEFTARVKDFTTAANKLSPVKAAKKGLEEAWLKEQPEAAKVLFAQLMFAKGEAFTLRVAEMLDQNKQPAFKVDFLAWYLQTLHMCAQRPHISLVRIPEEREVLLASVSRVIAQSLAELPANRAEAEVLVAFAGLFSPQIINELPTRVVDRALDVGEEMPALTPKLAFLRNLPSAGGAFTLEEEPVQLPPDTLELRFFGAFQARDSYGTILAGRDVSRNVKRMFGLLAARKGGAVSREWLQQVLWPNSTEEHARKSFYNLCSYVRRKFVDSKGKCPYLKVDKSSVWLDPYKVHTDIDILEDLITRLMETNYSALEAQVLLKEFERVHGTFLAGMDDEFLLAIGNTYRNKKAEALLVAGEYLYSRGDLRIAKSFAQMAVDTMRVREDAYYLLMCIQRDLGQHAAAIETFLTCRKQLVEQFGIDGPRRLETLYRELLGEQ